MAEEYLFKLKEIVRNIRSSQGAKREEYIQFLLGYLEAFEILEPNN